jgi:cytidylate kinase
MAIITISRELAALGDETAQELAKLLDYRFVDKRTLDDTIKACGVPARKLEMYDERKPSFLAALSQDRDDYLHYLKTSLLNEAENGNCVFIGRGANVICKDVPGLIPVFLVAPFEIRCERVKSYFHCDDRRARQIIERSDHDREGFHRYFFDVTWKEPGNYHLTINTGYLHPSVCARMIRDLRDHLVSDEIEARSLLRIRELILGQKVIHHILYERGIPIHFLEAQASETTVTLYGVANSQALVEAAVSAAREMPSAGRVQSEIQVVQEYSVMP